MSNLIQGNTGAWEIVIGLEVHAQVTTHSKLFSTASTEFGAEPNQHVAFVDAGMPGMLPVINEVAITQAIRTGFGINAQINRRSVFDRKNYFYPDLPQGYQISQLFEPIVGPGFLMIDLPDGSLKRIGIQRIHLEQDAGKSLHEHSKTETFIDLNRAGVALMEIVSDPEMCSAEEAAAYFKKLRGIVRYLGTCDGDLEKGNMRADANVSVRKPGAPLGTRCEIKNLNSVRFLQKAIEFEAMRQVELIESGGTVAQETRLFDTEKGETRTMRSKEDAHDYRYFPDPDLLPLELSEELIASIRANLPELPDAKRDRYVQQFSLSLYDANVLVSERETAEYFEQLTAAHDPKLAANWMVGELFARLNKRGLEMQVCPISPSSFGQLLGLMENNTISGKIAKDVLDRMFDTGASATEIVEKEGLQQVTDTGAIDAVIASVLAANADKLAEYRSGKEKLFGFFVGQVMKESGGKANPAAVNELLKKALQT